MKEFIHLERRWRDALRTSSHRWRKIL